MSLPPVARQHVSNTLTIAIIIVRQRSGDVKLCWKVSRYRGDALKTFCSNAYLCLNIRGHMFWIKIQELSANELLQRFCLAMSNEGDVK